MFRLVRGETEVEDSLTARAESRQPPHATSGGHVGYSLDQEGRLQQHLPAARAPPQHERLLGLRGFGGCLAGGQPVVHGLLEVIGADPGRDAIPHDVLAKLRAHHPAMPEVVSPRPDAAVEEREFGIGPTDLPAGSMPERHVVAHLVGVDTGGIRPDAYGLGVVAEATPGGSARRHHDTVVVPLLPFHLPDHLDLAKVVPPPILGR